MKSERVVLRVTAAEARLWKRAASEVDLTLSGWLRNRANMVAESEAGQPKASEIAGTSFSAAMIAKHDLRRLALGAGLPPDATLAKVLGAIMERAGMPGDVGEIE